MLSDCHNVLIVPQVTLETSTLEVYENVSTIVFSLARSGDTSVPAVVQFKTMDVAVDDGLVGEEPARGKQGLGKSTT